MTKTQEITEEVQQRVLESVRAGQEALVTSVSSWSQTVEHLFRRLPELTYSDSAKPNQEGNYTFESSYDFVDQLVKSQREFASRLLEAMLPVTRSATQATDQAARQAQQRPAPSK